MAYDAQAPAEVTVRDRVIMLRDFLAELPEEKFCMSDWGEQDYARHVCRTPACIAGWGDALFFNEAAGPSWMDRLQRLAAHLGLTGPQAHDLFQSVDSSQTVWFTPKPADAVATLDYYLATGKINWSVA